MATQTTIAERDGLNINNLIITKHETLGYGCHITGKNISIVGVGCILYDPFLKICMLGNEYNKQNVILHRNPTLSPQLGYFEDFGGKLEDKHEWMHLFDVALGELYEETCLVFNLNFDDLRTCLDKGWYALIPVPVHNIKHYICFMIPFDLSNFRNIQDVFQSNLKHITTNSNMRCEKQFYEISRVNFFEYDTLTGLTASTQPHVTVTINGFYGSQEELYICKEICLQEDIGISERLATVIQEFNRRKKENLVSDDIVKITGTLVTRNGLQHFMSAKHLQDVVKTETAYIKYLQKYFLPRIKPETRGIRIAIGGDVPLMYYDEIVSSLNSEAERHSAVGTEITKLITLDKNTPIRLVIYTSNPCVTIEHPHKMYFNGDMTNVCLKKWMTNDTGDIESYTQGVFFHLNDKIYFSYKKGDTYQRIVIGMVKIIDDTIITYDNIVYKQTLAVDAGNAIGIAAMEKLIELKKNKSPVLNYFHDDVINSSRQWNEEGVTRFRNYAKDQLPGGSNRTHVENSNVASLHIKGKYKMFGDIQNVVCNSSNIPLFSQNEYKSNLIENFQNLRSIPTNFISNMVDNLEEINLHLSRASDPFEFDCSSSTDITHSSVSVFDLKDTNKFVYNGLMFASEATKKIPDMYLSAGLNDCFIITGTAKCLLPLYRLKEPEGQKVWDKALQFYQVAYECIFPPKLEFEVKSVEYKLISVCTLKLNQARELIDDDDKKKYYWKRVITISPVVYQPAARGGHAKPRKAPPKKKSTAASKPATFF